MSRVFRLPDKAAADALQRRLKGTGLEAVQEAPRAATAKGSRFPGRNEGTNYSVLLARQVRMAGLPAPVLEYPFAKPERDYRADLAYPDLRLLIEVDGAVHRIKERFSADLLRDQVIFFLGWRKLRVSPKQVQNGDALTLVERALATRP